MRCSASVKGWRGVAANAAALFLAAGLCGCADLPAGQDQAAPGDPWERMNRTTYRLNSRTDTYVIRPVAEAYEKHIPQPVRTGVSNFFGNLGDLLSAMNNVLQLKPGAAGSDGARVLINTTIGIFGIFDWATPMGIKKTNEDFGQTLGYWGVPSGPYLVLPLLGPSSVRDSSGLYADSWADPSLSTATLGSDWAVYSLVVLRGINKRAELLKVTDMLDSVSLDPYRFTRDAYLKLRQRQAYDGNPPEDAAPPKDDFKYEEIE